MTRRNIDPAQSRAVFRSQIDGTEEIVLLSVEQDVVGQRAGGDDTHDVAFDDALGGLGIFDLLAYGDPVAGLEHLFQISLDGVIGYAGQRDRIRALTSAGQSQAEDLRANLGVFVEGLVEIAHAKKQNAVWVFLLEPMKLLRRQFFIGRGHRGRLYKVSPML